MAGVATSLLSGRARADTPGGGGENGIDALTSGIAVATGAYALSQIGSYLGSRSVGGSKPAPRSAVPTRTFPVGTIDSFRRGLVVRDTSRFLRSGSFSRAYARPDLVKHLGATRADAFLSRAFAARDARRLKIGLGLGVGAVAVGAAALLMSGRARADTPGSSAPGRGGEVNLVPALAVGATAAAGYGAYRMATRARPLALAPGLSVPAFRAPAVAGLAAPPTVPKAPVGTGRRIGRLLTGLAVLNGASSGFDRDGIVGAWRGAASGATFGLSDMLLGGPAVPATASGDAGARSLAAARMASRDATGSMVAAGSHPGGRHAAATLPAGDGMTDAYTRTRNGKIESVAGYTTPARV